MSHVISHTDVLIADGQTVASTVIDLHGYLLAGLILPAEFEGTAVTFQACDTDEGTFLDCYNSDGTAMSATVAASRHVLIAPTDFAGARYVKLVAGTAQTGDVTVKAVLHREF